MAKDHLLCHVDDIAEDSCKSFTIQYSNRELELFIIRRNSDFFLYRNLCPHTGANLNWQPDVFMDYDNLYIQCAIHGARFEVETGLCVWGPCINQRLMRVDFYIQDNDVFLK